jgi:hypothetical protein
MEGPASIIAEVARPGYLLQVSTVPHMRPELEKSEKSAKIL